MTGTISQTPDWYQGTTLSERIETTNFSRQNHTNHQQAKRRLEKWRTQKPFTTDGYFSQRLAIDKLTENDLYQMLGESNAKIKHRFSTPPDWLLRVEQAFENPNFSDPFPLPSNMRHEPIFGFLNAIKPLIHQGVNVLRQGVDAVIEGHEKRPFNPDTILNILYHNLPRGLVGLLTRTMVLELNVARIQGVLEGDTSEVRFQHFIERLKQPEVALSLLREYAVLTRQIVTRIDQWIHFSLEFLQHLCADWAAIQATFPDNDLGILTAVEGEAGDRHRNGRSVMIAKFSTGFQIVYKPKSLAVEKHFQALLAWLNERGDHPPFRLLKIIDRDTYGWLEFVTTQACRTEAEIERFYERQGAYLALLYAIEATDFHYNNLIAAGEHPILVDLESLFHPHLPGNQKIVQSTTAAGQAMAYSVLRVGMLPQRLWGHDKLESTELSGLGGAEGQTTPYPVLIWENSGTDNMRMVRKPVTIPIGNNRPSIHGRPIDILNYAEAIVTGFSKMYHLLCQHQSELLAANGPLANFAQDDVRVVFRPTYTYDMLLQESQHPDLLRDGLELDRFFDRLWEAIPQAPFLPGIIPHEKHDLLNGDVPIFSTRPGSCDLWSSTQTHIVNFFRESGLALSQHRLQQLSQADLNRQIWFIRASLITMKLSRQHAEWRSYTPQPSNLLVTPNRLIESAQAIGDWLTDRALYGEEDVTWLGLTLLREGYWALRPLGIDLYSGLPGVILFLAHLSIHTGKTKYKDLAQLALSNMQQQIKNRQEKIFLVGSFSGWGGVMYAYTHLATLWHEPALLTEANKIVDTIASLIEQDDQLDVIGGVAGSILTLLNLYHLSPTKRTFDVALACGEHLLAQAKPMPSGIGWIRAGMGETPLTGLSHGAAGIALALLKLAAVTGQERFKQAAMEAIAYERHVFIPAMNNWPDLREVEEGSEVGHDHIPCMTAWCHGAPGIGLARLASLPYLHDTKAQEEITTAVTTTLKNGFGMNHSLCHGDLGNLELLTWASQALNRPHWQQKASDITASVLASFKKHGWLSGVPLSVETPGLMTGLSGIGYGLLRLANPQQVPSVLTLELPNY